MRIIGHVVCQNRLRIFLLTSIGFWLSCQVEVQEQVSSDFELHPDFRMTLIASEPQVLDPIDFVFDAMGEAYVLEMPGYPLSDEESRLIKLKDSDEDGVYDQRIVFATNLHQATSILPYQQGFLVAAPPELLFIRDTNADDRADLRQVLMKGFSVGNLQHNYNGLSYGIDNWIYGANGGNNGEPYWAQTPEEKFPLRRGDFRFKPQLQLFERIGRSSGGHVITFDDWGRVYMTHNVKHISTMEIYDRYRGDVTLIPTDNQHLISDHEENGLARIYSIGEQETRVNHPEQSGYFSGGCGITYYGGGAFPSEFKGNVFVADVVVNAIHRDVIAPDGSSVVASRGRPDLEFLASRDRHFRPVNMTVGPDGCLYIVDMHRDVIEHPEWIPDELEVDMDLAAGKDQGRIYKISARASKEIDWQPPATMDDESLVAALSAGNQWMRLNAQRLLIERNALPTPTDPQSFIASQPNPVGRVHALWTLEGLDKLSPDIIVTALADEVSHVKIQALKLAENFTHHEEITSAMMDLAHDADPEVRRQLALSLSTMSDHQLEHLSLTKLLMKILADQPSDIWIQQAVMLAARTRPLDLVRQLDMQHSLRSDDMMGNLYTMLAVRIAEEVKFMPDLMSYLNERDIESRHLIDILQGLERGVQQTSKPDDLKSIGPSLALAIDALESRSNSLTILARLWSIRSKLGLGPSPRFAQGINQAILQAGDESISTSERMANLSLLPFAAIDAKKDLLYRLLGSDQPRTLQEAAIDQLSSLEYGTLGEDLIQMWPNLGPSVRRSASNILLYKEAFHPQLLDALESGELKLAEFNFDLERRRRLLKSDDLEIRERAKSLFSDAGVVQRGDAIERMQPALTLEGDKDRGSQIFLIQCSQCHKYSEDGVDVGPDLTEISRKSKETLLHDILDPNAAADVQYIAHIVTTEQGVISGIISDERDDQLTMMTVGGSEKMLRRDQIKEIRSTGLSFMPEGLEATISTQEMADLLAFLQQNVL